MTAKYTDEQQRQLCEAWLASDGISLKQFCQESKISKSSIYKWLKTHGAKSAVNEELKLLPADEEKTSAEGLEILLPNGALVRGNSSVMINLIMDLLK